MAQARLTGPVPPTCSGVRPPRAPTIDRALHPLLQSDPIAGAKTGPSGTSVAFLRPQASLGSSSPGSIPSRWRRHVSPKAGKAGFFFPLPLVFVPPASRESLIELSTLVCRGDFRSDRSIPGTENSSIGGWVFERRALDHDSGRYLASLLPSYCHRRSFLRALCDVQHSLCHYWVLRGSAPLRTRPGKEPCLSQQMAPTGAKIGSDLGE